MDISFSKNKIIFSEHNKQLGYLKFYCPNDISGKRNIDIEYLYVKPAFRRKGLATKMILFFLKNLENVTWVSLWTGRQMEMDNSYELYKKLGFKEMTYQPDYYEDGIGTRLFVKKIKHKKNHNNASCH